MPKELNNKFKLIGDDIYYDHEKVGVLTVPTSTLRDCVTDAILECGALLRAAYDYGYCAGGLAGYEEGFAEGREEGDV